MTRTILACLSILALATSVAAAQSSNGSGGANAAPTTAAPPPANSVAWHVNEKLPTWMRFGGEYRIRFEGVTGIKGVEENDDAFVLSRLRLNVEFKLGEHVRLFAEGQDSQAGGFDADPDPPIHQNDFDLRQAYVELRQAATTGWSLRVGRQDLSYGDQRLVGASYWTNTARSFDAAKLTYADERLAVDAFASTVVAIGDDRFDHHVDGQNFYGTHARLFKAIPRGELSTYVFWKTTPSVAGELGGSGDADTVTFGARAAGSLTTSTDYVVELIGQRGSFADDEIRAGAAHARLGYALSARPAAPKLRVEYNFAAGDASPSDGVRGTFDQLYPTNHGKYGIIDQVGYKNLHEARVGVTLKPHPRLTIDADYHSFWLAHRKDGLYDASGNLVARIATGAPGAHIAQEADVEAVFAVAERVSFGAGYGHWFPGEFWKAATPGAARDYVYTYVTYTF